MGEQGRIRISGRGKVRVIEEVKSLQPELDSEILRKLLNPNVLKERHIEILKTWTDQAVSAGTAEPSAWAGKSKALGLDVIDRISWVYRGPTAWSREPIRKIKGSSGKHAKGIAPNLGCKRDP